MTDQLADLFTPEPENPDPLAQLIAEAEWEHDGVAPGFRLTASNRHAAIARAVEEHHAAEVAQLRRALVDVLGHVEAGTSAPGNRIRAWRELAGTEYVDGLEPLERGMEGSARAAARWTPEELAQVDAAIRAVAASRLDVARTALAPSYVDDLMAYPETSDKLLEFTTADVWAMLGEGFPVTKGIAGRMIAAKNAGLIRSTGRTTYPEGERSRVNHNQRLTVWRALAP